MFFHVFETLCTKFARNAKKERFLSILRDGPQKCEKTVFFSRFLRDTLYKVRKKSERTAFFCAMLCKKYDKTVFFHVFRDTLCIVSKKCEKQRFLSFLFDVPKKSVRKQCFFHVFRDTLNKVRKKCEKQRFLSFLLDVPQKVWGNSVFSRLLGHFVQSSRKKFKNRVFFFCATLCKECEKTMFFHLFRDTLYKVRRKWEKSAFFARRLCKKSEKTVFFSRFSRHFVQSSQKMRKFSVFWAFSATFPKKCE